MPFFSIGVFGWNTVTLNMDTVVEFATKLAKSYLMYVAVVDIKYRMHINF